MTAPDLVEVVANVIADNSVVIHEHSDYGELTASTLTPDEMARAVLAALTEAGNVEWGVEYRNDDGSTTFGRDRFKSRDEAHAIARKYGDTLVSRLTLPWTAVEG